MHNENSKEIIYPSSMEVMKYLNDEHGICNKCGAVMNEEVKNKISVYICPACNWEIDVMDYEYEDSDDMEFVQDERCDEYLIYKNDMPPAGCKTCGGPYPYCKPTCKTYDD